MSDFEEFLHQEQPPERTVAKPSLPHGWEPGIQWSNETDSGTIVTDDMTGEPDQAIWNELIDDWGLDPETMEIVDGSIELIGWDGQLPDGAGKIRLKRYKARLRRKRRAGDKVDVDYLCSLVEQRSAVPPVRTTQDAERALVANLSDWQLGKGEGGGTEAAVERITGAFQRLEDKLAELTFVRRRPDVIYVVGLGDLVEQCTGNYPGQEFTTDLNRRQQMRLARRLLLDLVDRLALWGVPIVLSAIAGNHGENRKEGKAYTTPDDNDDLAVFEQVGDVLAANPERYGHVSLYLPTRLSMTLDICGVPVGFTHGHVARGGGSHPAAKLQTWWQGQVMGNQPVADAQILVTAHYHHLIIAESSGRTHMQCPAMDGGSQWWTESTGQNSPAGMLVFCVGKSYGPRGWGDLEVL